MNLKRLGAWAILGLASTQTHMLLLMDSFDTFYINIIAGTLPVLFAFTAGLYIGYTEKDN